jgi:hypothetical protein
MNKFTFANISTFGSIAAIYLLAIVPPLCSLAFLFHGCLWIDGGEMRAAR